MCLEPLDEVLDAEEALAVEGQPIILDFNVFPNNLVLLLDIEQRNELGELARTSEVVVDDAGVLLPV